MLLDGRGNPRLACWFLTLQRLVDAGGTTRLILRISISHRKKKPLSPVASIVRENVGVSRADLGRSLSPKTFRGHQLLFGFWESMIAVKLYLFGVKAHSCDLEELMANPPRTRL